MFLFKKKEKIKSIIFILSKIKKNQFNVFRFCAAKIVFQMRRFSNFGVRF
jgi:hypothetical protein